MATTSFAPIAIVGIAGLFPQAHTIREYWQNILTGRNCITEVPPSRWRIADYYDPDPEVPDKTYSKYGGFLPDVEFDPVTFGLPPSILEVTDTSQLLPLLVAQKLLDDTGYTTQDTFDHTRTAVILGVTVAQKLVTPLTSRLQYPLWEQVLRASGLSDEQTSQVIERLKHVYLDWQENAFPGLLGNVVAGRIANRFDLGGTNCTVDAACASSLGALKLAVSELAEGNCDMAISGGVDTDNTAFMYMCFSKTMALSPHTCARPFDQHADGTIIGEGIGMMLLKRLGDAERDGDTIYAVIRGIGSSSDGRHGSIYAPVVAGQVAALERAYAQAGIAPDSVGMVEAHGTGTAAGDMAEVEALRRVYQQAGARRQSVALGSVKSQIGHTKGAAGAAGLIKAALALHHKVLPPTINITAPHPGLRLEESPFYLNTEARPWIGAAHAPRRAAVSSFGFGGTNYHIILEEYQSEHTGRYRLHDRPHSLILAADTPAALLARCEESLTQLHGDQADGHYAKLLAASVTPDIPTRAARLGCVVGSLDDARACLERAAAMLRRQPESPHWQHPDGIFYRQHAIPKNSRVVALFAGQGSQYVGMGRSLALSFPELREAFRELDMLYAQHDEPPLSDIVFPAPTFSASERTAQAGMLQQTRYAQPAIGALSVGLYRVLCQSGFQPDMLAGQSFGELTALWAAGVLDERAFFTLARARGQAMTRPSDGTDAGAMLAVVGEVDKLPAILEADAPDVAIVNWNAPDQVVIAGATAAVEAAQPTLQARGYAVTRLPVSAAFHTPLISYAREPFLHALEGVAVQAPALPVYANTTAERYPTDPRTIRHLLLRHMLEPVVFRQQIERMADDGGYVFVEIGPRDTLTRLVDATLGNRPHLALSLCKGNETDSERHLQAALVQLQVAGMPIRTADPYALHEPVAPPRRRGMPVRLSASNYVSETTRMNQEKALQPSKPVTATSNGAAYQADIPATQNGTPHHNGMRHTAFPASVQAQTDAYQHETQRVYEKLVDQQTDTAAALTDLVQQQQAVLLNHLQTPAEPAILDALQKNLALLHTEQAESRQHAERYLETRTEYMRLLLQRQEQQVIAAPAAPPVSEPPSESSVPEPPAAPTVPPESGPVDTTSLLLKIVSDKTGYPIDILDMDMELEADLGIDSIKRVQILGTLQEALPDLPRLAPEELAELRTLRQITDMMNAGKAVTESAPPAALSQSAVRIRPLPEPDTQDYTLPAGYVCLLTDDGTDLTGALAAQFMALHWPVMLLQFPRELVTSTATLPTGLPAITLEDMSEETLAVALQTIQQEHGPVGAFLHLHPPNSTTTASEQIVRHIFLLSNQLHQLLTEAAHQGQSWFFTVTHIDGAFGMEVAAGIDPVQGGLSGLVKSLNLEWEHVFCRALDINLDSAQAVNAIVAELFDPNWLLTEVAYSSQGRRTRIGESLTG